MEHKCVMQVVSMSMYIMFLMCMMVRYTGCTHLFRLQTKLKWIDQPKQMPIIEVIAFFIKKISISANFTSR
jgi:hypothetical protein